MGGFKPHQLVRLQGLDNEAWNGKLALVKSLVLEDGRHRVQVRSEDGDAATLGQVVSIKPENMAHACNHCHKADVAEMLFCGKCRMAGYCNAECQRNDWQRHKGDCTNLGIHRDMTKSPLFVAALNGDSLVVQSLLQQGAEVNRGNSSNKMAPLVVAALRGHLDVVRFLVEQNADKEKATTDGATPLIVAAGEGRLAVLQYLVQQGADKNKTCKAGCTPLLVAAKHGQLSVAKYLVQQGADMNKADNDGVSALLAATTKGHIAVATYLREQGAT